MNTSSTSFCLERMTWPQVAAAQKNCPLLVVPLGATEQHGPALPIGTDSLIVTALCEEACPRAGVPFAPTLRFTSSAAHTLAWPGTFPVTARTFMDSTLQITRWALASGWERCMFVNGHAGNSAPLKVVLDQLRLEFMGRCQVGFLDAFTLSADVEKAYFGDVQDFHANQAEADLIRFLAPETLDEEALPEADDPDRTEGLVFSYPVAQTSCNGTTGFPSRACAERGQKLFQEMVTALAQHLQKARHESPPLTLSAQPGIPVNFFT